MKKKEVVNKKSKKKVTKKKVSKKKDPNVKLWSTDEEGELVMVTMKPQYIMVFVYNFGVRTIPNKIDFDEWYSEIDV